MSLLLDALKRAEQEKLARQGERGGAPDPAAGTPEIRPAARGAGSFELESLEPARAATPAPSAAAGPGDRASAQTVFAAKTEALPSTASKTPLVVGGVVLLAVIAAGGAYVWYQVNTMGPKPYASRAAPNAPAFKPITPTGQPDFSPGSVTPLPGSPSGPLLMPPAAPVPAPASGAPIASATPRKAPPVAMLSPQGVSPESRKTRPPAADAEKLVLDLLQENAKAGAAPPLRLARSMEPLRVVPEVAAGYEALKRNDLAGARRSYQAALANDPASVDALLGLATVDARSGERASAERHYRRVLAVDPRNATALAGLAAIADFSRPAELESRLKADIARYPASPALRMTLGNLYASRGQWADAQGAFFEALRLDPTSADVLYNLAVSLDNLGQSKLAGDFYRRALTQVHAGSPVQFDARAAERRLAELKP